MQTLRKIYFLGKNSSGNAYIRKVGEPWLLLIGGRAETRGCVKEGSLGKRREYRVVFRLRLSSRFRSPDCSERSIVSADCPTRRSDLSNFPIIFTPTYLYHISIHCEKWNDPYVLKENLLLWCYSWVEIYCSLFFRFRHRLHVRWFLLERRNPTW